jgi:hypothetical protein
VNPKGLLRNNRIVAEDASATRRQAFACAVSTSEEPIRGPGYEKSASSHVRSCADHRAAVGPCGRGWTRRYDILIEPISGLSSPAEGARHDLHRNRRRLHPRSGDWFIGLTELRRKTALAASSSW